MVDAEGQFFRFLLFYLDKLLYEMKFSSQQTFKSEIQDKNFLIGLVKILYYPTAVSYTHLTLPTIYSV